MSRFVRPRKYEKVSGQFVRVSIVTEPNPSANPPPEFDRPELPVIEKPERAVFQHPEWMVGIVLICGVFAILAGLIHPVWWLTGSPCILALAIWIYGKVRSSRIARRRGSGS
jgi:hypothetical protein